MSGESSDPAALEEGSKMIRPSFVLGLIGTAFVLAACAAQTSQMPTAVAANSTGIRALAAARPAHHAAFSPRPGTAVWGVGASGYSGGPAGGTYLFNYCDTTIYTNPSSQYCYGETPYVYGKRSMSVSHSATAPCYVSGSIEYGTCSGNLSTAFSLGKFAIGSAVSASGNPSDPSAVSEGTVQESSFADQITVTSSTLPSGTAVKLKETLEIIGSYTFDCSSPGLINEDVLYELSGLVGWLRGDCENGSFVQYSNQGAGTKEATKFEATVGSTYDLNPILTSELNVWDCTKTSPSGGTCQAFGGSSSASMQITKATYHLVPVTPNVTLVSASGKVY